jgi:two-component system CheB/CheR fusion protein
MQIFATDLDQHAIQKAREGVFPVNIAADVPPNLLDRYFVKEERGYRVAKSIREMIIFAPQNLISDPPFTKLDLVSCRNLLIYLTTDLQKKLLPVFHYSLNPGGFLFLGSAETVGTYTNLFSPLKGKTRIHRRLDSPLTPEAFEFPTTLFAPKPAEAAKPAAPVTNLQTLADELILRHFSPAAVLTNDKGDILYISGSTGKYLEPAAGKANWNIFVMVREGLRHGLLGAFQQAVRTKETVTPKNMWLATSAGRQEVQVTIQSLKGTSPLRGMVMIVFKDIPTRPQARRSGPLSKDSALVKEMELDLDRTRQEVQSIREEMQSSQEELKSANEEMQSANEELQSTNEELTTAKEELQSMNEELHTVNHELESRLDELSHINNDMKNLLDSTDIATLFVDNNLCVRRFTNETGKIPRLIPGDVGRPITDIASALLYPELADDAREVLRTLAKVEKQISSTQTGSWYKVRILPYRTFENLIDGVVITFTDITEYKKLEGEFRITEDRLREQLDRK